VDIEEAPTDIRGFFASSGTS